MVIIIMIKYQILPINSGKKINIQKTMKLKIKYKVNDEGQYIHNCLKGDWVDLIAAQSYELHPSQADTLKSKTVDGVSSKYRNVTSEVTYIKLGIAMELPKGFEAIVAPRSSTPKNFGIVCANSIGIIDNSYCGNNDIWRMPVLAMEDTFIPFNDRIAQFRFMPRMQYCDKKFKFGINFVQTDDLGTEDRGGFGSSGKNNFFG